MQITQNSEYGREVSTTFKYFLEHENAVIIQGEINQDLALEVISDLYYLSNQDKEKLIKVYIINSPGGQVASAMAILDAASLIPNPIRTIGMGSVASAASFLLTTMATEKRLVSSNCELMYHQPLGGVGGQASDIAIVADKITQIKNKLNKMLASHSKLTLKQTERLFDRDCWLEPKEAIEKGLIDRIMESEDFCHE